MRRWRNCGDRKNRPSVHVGAVPPRRPDATRNRRGGTVAAKSCGSAPALTALGRPGLLPRRIAVRGGVAVGRGFANQLALRVVGSGVAAGGHRLAHRSARRVDVARGVAGRGRFAERATGVEVCRAVLPLRVDLATCLPELLYDLLELLPELRLLLLLLLVAAKAPEAANAQVTATVSAETKNLFMTVTPS